MLSIVILAVAVVFLILVGINNLAETLLFPVGMSVLFVIYWLVSNVLSVVWLGSFEGKTDEQKRSYYLYAASDAAGLAGLIFFLVNTGSTTGVIIFVASVVLKRKFMDQFRGVSKEENDGDSDAQEALDENRDSNAQEVLDENRDSNAEDVSDEMH